MAGYAEDALKTRFEACMVLSGVGDAIGFKNGAWEFCRSGERIHEQLQLLGGIEAIKVDPQRWMVSDDTVMHIATAEALVSKWANHEELFHSFAKQYKLCMKDMTGRAPGLTCKATVHTLRPGLKNGYVIPFNPRGGGCGAAMRSAPIGIFFSKPEQVEELITVAVEAGRMSHNHPTGFLGSLATALFVSYAIQGKPLEEWGVGLIQSVELAKQYVEETGRDIKENRENWSYFVEKWTEYLKLRGIENGKSKPLFPVKYGVAERDQFYKNCSFSGTGGASGHDAPMIAYDALLCSGDSWNELCLHSMLHGGDSDSTGIIAAACWGAMYGYKGVPEGHYKNLEYLKHLESLANKLYKRSNC